MSGDCIWHLNRRPEFSSFSDLARIICSSNCQGNLHSMAESLWTHDNYTHRLMLVQLLLWLNRQMSMATKFSEKASKLSQREYLTWNGMFSKHAWVWLSGVHKLLTILAYTEPKIVLEMTWRVLNIIFQVPDTPQVKVTSASSSPTEDQLQEAEQLKIDGIHRSVLFLCNKLNVGYKHYIIDKKNRVVNIRT